MSFREALKSQVLILDGSMGALLQKRGLPHGHAPDLWNLENPNVIAAVHREYFEAGSQLLLTNTFGATPPRLQEYGAEKKIHEINLGAVDILRSVIGDKAFVAGDVGPLGLVVEPTGELSFEEAVSYFYAQAKVLVEAGVDLFAIETMFDLAELRAAVIGIREASTRVPIIAHMTYNMDGLTDTGTSPSALVALMEGFAVDAVGVNCSTGPEHMLPVVQAYAELTMLPIVVQPNAGLPEIRGGETVFPLVAEAMAEYAIPFWQAGASIVGGCCGTTPKYIALISKILADKQPIERTIPQCLKVAGRSEVVEFSPTSPFVSIGERINPTGRKAFTKAIEEGKVDLIVEEAKEQAQAGALALDVNVGVPLVNEALMMEKAVRAIQSVGSVPLVIDSSYAEALEAGLRIYVGKPLINSINAEEERLDAVLPLIKKYGAAVIALLAQDEIPEKASDRLRCAEKILKRLDRVGIPQTNLIFDVLSLPVSAAPLAARETLETIRLVKKELGIPTLFGLSNVSFGLPQRGIINRAFLAQAIAAGLDGAILNPFDNDLRMAILAASLFAGRDPDCKRYIDFMGHQESAATKDSAVAVGSIEKTEKTLRGKIFDAVVEGDKVSVVPLLEEALLKGEDPLSLFTETLTPAIRHLGDLFGQRKKFIPHLISAAEAMKAGVSILAPLLERKENEAKGTVIFATVKGDIHDIGKNICILMLRNFGYNVIDLGRNISCQDIIAAAKEHKAEIIALSALMTTTMMQMKVVIEAVAKEGLPTKVMIGGAVVTPRFAEEVKADGYGKDVGSVVPLTERLLSAFGFTHSSQVTP